MVHYACEYWCCNWADFSRSENKHIIRGFNESAAWKSRFCISPVVSVQQHLVSSYLGQTLLQIGFVVFELSKVSANLYPFYSMFCYNIAGNWFHYFSLAYVKNVFSHSVVERLSRLEIAASAFSWQSRIRREGVCVADATIWTLSLALPFSCNFIQKLTFPW